jgi:hypothetical protein
MLNEFKVLWMCDTEHTLILPGESFGEYVRAALYSTVNQKGVLFNASSGKPARYMWNQNYRAVAEEFPQILEHLVLTGNNGLESWINISPDGQPGEILLYDAKRNSVARAVEELNLLTDALVEEFGDGIKEQVNAAYEGQRLMGTLFPVNMPTAGLEVKCGGIVYPEGNAPIQTEQIPSVDEVYNKALGIASKQGLLSIKVIKHADAIDILICGAEEGNSVNKGYGVARVAERFGIRTLRADEAYQAFEERINPHCLRAVKQEYLSTHDSTLILGNCTGDGSNDLEAMQRMALGVSFKYSSPQLRRLATTIVSNPHDALLASASNLEFLMQA